MVMDVNNDNDNAHNAGNYISNRNIDKYENHSNENIVLPKSIGVCDTIIIIATLK